MLKVWFGYRKDGMSNPDAYFNNTYDEEWLDDELVRRMVEGVDKSMVLSRHCIESPALGQIPPERLSGGVKALILMLKAGGELREDGLVIDLIACGENCEKWIKEIGSRVDVEVCISGYDLHFSEGIQFLRLNDDKMCDGQDDWIDSCIDFINAE